MDRDWVNTRLTAWNIKWAIFDLFYVNTLLIVDKTPFYFILYVLCLPESVKYEFRILFCDKTVSINYFFFFNILLIQYVSHAEPKRCTGRDLLFSSLYHSLAPSFCDWWGHPFGWKNKFYTACSWVFSDGMERAVKN